MNFFENKSFYMRIVRFGMKKFVACFVLGIILTASNVAEAHYCHSHYYVTYKDYFQEEQSFVNCDKHYILKETSVYYYSNGTRRSYIVQTIFNQDGSVLVSGCSEVKHFVYNKYNFF